MTSDDVEPDESPCSEDSSSPVTPLSPTGATTDVVVKNPSSVGSERRSWWPSIRLLLALVLLLALLVAVLVLEVRADLPLITDIREMPDVEAFRVETYVPFRRQVDDWIGQWLG